MSCSGLTFAVGIGVTACLAVGLPLTPDPILNSLQNQVLEAQVTASGLIWHVAIQECLCCQQNICGEFLLGG